MLIIRGLKSLIANRELLVILTTREIRARYRQSVLGFGWALVQPVFQMVVISIVFGSFLNMPSGDVPYPVFSYVAILPWTLFAGSITAAVPSVHSNMNLVTKVYFPREILPLSVVLSRFIDFFIASVVFIGLMIWFRLPVYPTLIYVPILLIVQTILAIGLGFLGSAVSVFLRDISFAVPLLMQLWMYATPIIYPISMVPEEYRGVYMLNPMAGIIISYRQVVLEGTPPHFAYLAVSAGIAVILLLLAYIYFKRLEMMMADIM